MDNATLKDILGIEEVDFEMLAEAYNKLPDAESHNIRRGGPIIQIPVFIPDLNLSPWDGFVPTSITYRFIEFEIKLDKGIPYWSPINKVYIS